MDEKEKLIEMCIYIMACNEIDRRVELGGNRAIPREAGVVSSEVLRILGVDESTLWDRVSMKVEEMEKE